VSGQLYANSGTGAFVVGRDLPYDAEVEYLQSSRSNSQYINLMTNVIEGEIVEIEYLNRYIGNSSSFFFGFYDSSTSSLGLMNNNGNTRLYYKGADTIASMDSNVWHTCVIDTANNTYSLDASTPVQIGRNYVESNYPIFLFGCNWNGSANYFSSARIKRFRIGTRMDLIPVRVGTTGYMYDRVSGTLFGNDGTGDFTIGPDV
jgi:hypothetical protein